MTCAPHIKEFNKDDLLKRFTDISKKAQDRLIDGTFKNLNRYFRVNYMDLKMVRIEATSPV